jgi:hypothetical protein
LRAKDKKANNMGNTTVAKNVKRKRIYVNEKGATVPQFEENNTRRPYEVVGLTCGDTILEKSAKADSRKTQDEVTAPIIAQEEIKKEQLTIEQKGKKMIEEIENSLLDELKDDLLKDEDFKAKMKAKILKKLFK